MATKMIDVTSANYMEKLGGLYNKDRTLQFIHADGQLIIQPRALGKYPYRVRVFNLHKETMPNLNDLLDYLNFDFDIFLSTKAELTDEEKTILEYYHCSGYAYVKRAPEGVGSTIIFSAIFNDDGITLDEEAYRFKRFYCGHMYQGLTADEDYFIAELLEDEEGEK